MTGFDATLAAHGLTLRRGRLQTLRLNVGRKCNQARRHCQVDAAPWRTEMLELATFDRIAGWIREHRPPAVDITGGAPRAERVLPAARRGVAGSRLPCH